MHDRKAIDPGSVPKATVARLVLYLRELQQLGRAGVLHVRSGVLADRLGLTDSQVRRDISCLGQYGRRGVGYPVRDLVRVIHAIVGSDRQWRVILIGMGNLGQALSGYKGFREQGFELTAVFDCDRSKVGATIHGYTIRSIDELDQTIEEVGGIQLAMLAVPAAAAATVTARLAALGIQGILNFAPVSIRRHCGDAVVLDVDLALELQRLAFNVVRK